MKLLRDKVAFVPGGYGGIGEAVCKALAQAGAKVIVAGRDLSKASRLARRIRGIALELDVRDTPSIERTLSRFRRIDLFVNCAGVSREETLDRVSEQAWDEVLGTNLKAAMFLAQAVARRQKRGGKQVHLLSVRSQLGMRGGVLPAWLVWPGCAVAATPLTAPPREASSCWCASTPPSSAREESA